MRRGGWWILTMGLLAGCQTPPSSLPVAEPAPSALCQWPIDADSVPVTLARVVAALENEAFVVRDTDPALGLVSAERAERTTYHNAVDPWPYGGVVFGGYGGRFSSGVVLGVGTGVGSVTEEATRIERVSVVVGAETVRVTRDTRLFDWRGYPRESRTASDGRFCQALREAIRRVPSAEVTS